MAKKNLSVADRAAAGRHERNRDNSSAINNNQRAEPPIVNPRPSRSEQEQQMKLDAERFRNTFKHFSGLPENERRLPTFHARAASSAG